MDATEVSPTPQGLGLPIWAAVLVTVAAALFWAVMMEGGPLSTALGQSGPFLHELFHDGRHLVGVPCH